MGDFKTCQCFTFKHIPWTCPHSWKKTDIWLAPGRIWKISKTHTQTQWSLQTQKRLYADSTVCAYKSLQRLVMKCNHYLNTYVLKYLFMNCMKFKTRNIYIRNTYVKLFNFKEDSFKIYKINISVRNMNIFVETMIYIWIPKCNFWILRLM